MSLFQAILIGLVAAVSQLEGGWLGEAKVREPVVTGALVGLILGDLKQGLIIGAQLQLIFMGAAAIGPTAGLSVGPGGTIGAAIALSTHTGVETAMIFAVPVSVLLQFIQTMIDTAYSPLMHKVDRLIDEGPNEKKIVFIHYSQLLVVGVVYFLLTFISLHFGKEMIEGIVNNIPEWASNGLNAVAKILPALGFALLLNLLSSKKLIPYFIIGFGLAAWLNVSMIGVAAFSVALALIMYEIKTETINTSNSLIEGEDEL